MITKKELAEIDALVAVPPEAFDPVEKTFYEMAFLVERPVDWIANAARRVMFDLCRCT